MNRNLTALTRRHFFQSAGFGIGGLALSSLTGSAAPRTHHPAKAKRVIFLFMAGAPSQLDMFDYKPKLNQFDGQPVPEEVVKGERFAFIQGTPRLLGSPHAFARYGQSGQEMSAILPHLAKVADDIAIIRSVSTTQFNHAPAQIFMNSGHQIPGRPSLGSWLTYGLGSENADLPGFVVLLSG
ncbi:MAG TPA: sulfatase, partial [Solibacterales bacterium]|nr:sulfatase [Bryobacterales bacterium]